MLLPVTAPACSACSLRVVASHGYSLLQRVPAALLSVRAIGSPDPGALLLDAAALYADGDARCDEATRALMRGGGDDAGGAMAVGVAQTIGAALAEWDHADQ